MGNSDDTEKCQAEARPIERARFGLGNRNGTFRDYRDRLPRGRSLPCDSVCPVSGDPFAFLQCELKGDFSNIFLSR
jgi:hypothetical protein